VRSLGTGDDMITWSPIEGTKALFRVSGTEPKLKCYIQAQAESHEAALEKLAELEKLVRAETSKASA
jgi:phosphomannomutase